MKALIVTGSRYGLKISEKEYEEKLVPLLNNIDLLIHGDAPGVDTIFKRLAVKYDIQHLPCPAPWKAQGPAAGPIRNEQMVKIGMALRTCTWDVVAAAFPGPNSKGTKNCIKLLEDASIPVVVVKIGK